MKKHRYIFGALMFIIIAPIFITVFKVADEIGAVNQLWSNRRLLSIGRTLLYGLSVGLLTTIIGWWIGSSLAIRFRQAKIISIFILCFMGIPPFIYAFFAMDISRVLLGIPFLSGFIVSLLVSVVYWLPLTISLWVLFTIAIPVEFYDEPRLTISMNRSLSLVGNQMMKAPAKMIGLIIILLSINDYSIPSIFAYNTYPIEIMTLFSSHSDIATPVLASVPIMIFSIILMMIILRYWAQLELDSTQIKHPLLRKGSYNYILLLSIVYIIIPMSLLIHSISDQLKSFYLSPSFISDIIFSYGASIVAALFMTLIACYMSYLFIRFKVFQRPILILIILALCLPGTLVGIMVNYFYQWLDGLLNLSIYTTMIPMVHMLVIRYIAIGFMVIWFGMNQISNSHFDLMVMHSISLRKVVSRVLWPYSKFYIIGSVMILMMFSLGELSGTIMVVPPGKSTVAVTIYNYLHYGSSDVVSMLVGLIFTSMIVLIGVTGSVLLWREKEGVR